MGKVEVLITSDQSWHRAEGDTAICYTIKNAEDFLKGKTSILDTDATIVGKEIPKEIYELALTAMVSSSIKELNKTDRVKAIIALHKASQILKEEGDKIGKEIVKDERGDACKIERDFYEALCKKAVERLEFYLNK